MEGLKQLYHQAMLKDKALKIIWAAWLLKIDFHAETPM